MNRVDEIIQNRAREIMGPEWVKRNRAPEQDPNPMVRVHGAGPDGVNCHGCRHLCNPIRSPQRGTTYRCALRKPQSINADWPSHRGFWRACTKFKQKDTDQVTEKAITERSVILTADEVRGILDGSLDRLERCLKRQPGRDYHSPIPITDRSSFWTFQKPNQGTEPFIVHSPFGGVGTHLWGRETFWMAHDSDNPSGYAVIDCGPYIECGVQYCATPENQDIPEEPGYWWYAPPLNWDGESDYHGRGTNEWLPWRTFTKFSSAQMPRAASRILLEVLDIRCERTGEDGPYRWICTFKKLEMGK